MGREKCGTDGVGKQDETSRWTSFFKHGAQKEIACQMVLWPLFQTQLAWPDKSLGSALEAQHSVMASLLAVKNCLA
jgi:hypothetical protein